MRRAQIAIAALGAVAILFDLTLLDLPGPIALGALALPATLAYAAIMFVLQQQGFVFRWREHSTKVSLDELGVFLGVLVLPPALVVLAIFGSAVATQLYHKRALLKGAFNAAQYSVAALLAVGACVLLGRAGVPAPWVALPAPAIFAAATAFQVSLVFSRIERTNPARIFVERFGAFVGIAAALGASLGLVAFALFHVHPAAVLAIVPLFVSLRRFGHLSEWADAELSTHRVVAEVSREVAGQPDMDLVSERIFGTCAKLFDCAEATLTLSRPGSREPRVWSRSFGASASSGGVSAAIAGAGSARIGSLSVFPKLGQRRYGEREQQLLVTVAASIAAAAANAQAIRAANEANLLQIETIKRLENMNRELEEFTLWTTHDMREPLRSIGTIAGFLHEDLGTIDVDEAKDMARRIQDGADRLKERVKALHAFSLIVQRDDEFQDVDMQALLEEVIAALETKIQEKGAGIELPRQRLPIVRAQPHRLHQVFANLVENALKYGRAEQPIVSIGCAETPSEWRFHVADNGPGIPVGYHDRIFQLFQRGPEPHEGGSGAGLAIVKRIAEQHSGRAWVESEPGKGARFSVAIPKPASASPPRTILVAQAL